MGLAHGYNVMAVCYPMAQIDCAQQLEAAIGHMGFRVLQPTTSAGGMALLLFALNGHREPATMVSDAEEALAELASQWQQKILHASY